MSLLATISRLKSRKYRMISLSDNRSGSMFGLRAVKLMGKLDSRSVCLKRYAVTSSAFVSAFSSSTTRTISVDSSRTAETWGSFLSSIRPIIFSRSFALFTMIGDSGENNSLFTAGKIFQRIFAANPDSAAT